MKEMRQRSPIGVKLGILSHLMGFHQGAVAEKSQVSRVTVNRFFTGKTDLRATDLVQLLGVLGINLEAEVEARLQCLMNGQPIPKNQEIYSDLAAVMDSLDENVRRTLFEQVVWWSKSSARAATTRASQRLEKYLGQP